MSQPLSRAVKGAAALRTARPHPLFFVSEVEQHPVDSEVPLRNRTSLCVVEGRYEECVGANKLVHFCDQACAEDRGIVGEVIHVQVPHLWELC